MDSLYEVLKGKKYNTVSLLHYSFNKARCSFFIRNERIFRHQQRILQPNFDDLHVRFFFWLNSHVNKIPPHTTIFNENPAMHF